MSADNYMHIQKVGKWYVVSMEFASDESAKDPACYKCGLWLDLNNDGKWVGKTQFAGHETKCPAKNEEEEHFAGGYTRVFDNIGAAWAWAQEEDSGANDPFGYGTEYGISMSEEVSKEMKAKLSS